MKHSRYSYKDRPAEIDLPVGNPVVTNHYRVICRRRNTPGQMILEDVPANSVTEADKLVREGKAVPGIGLGWIPLSITLLPSS